MVLPIDQKIFQKRALWYVYRLPSRIWIWHSFFESWVFRNFYPGNVKIFKINIFRVKHDFGGFRGAEFDSGIRFFVRSFSNKIVNFFIDFFSRNDINWLFDLSFCIRIYQGQAYNKKIVEKPLKSCNTRKIKILKVLTFPW